MVERAERLLVGLVARAYNILQLVAVRAAVRRLVETAGLVVLAVAPAVIM